MANINKSVAAEQTSTNDFALVTAAKLNAKNSTIVSFTIKNTGANTINWKVLAGHEGDLSDGVEVKASASLAAGVTGTYTVFPAPYSYYGIYIESAVDGSHGEATVRGVAKG